MSHERQHEVIDAARQRAQLDLQQLWLRYVGLGGDAGPLELEAYLSGLMSFDDYQHDILAHALNERFQELGLPSDMPYRLAVPQFGDAGAAVPDEGPDDLGDGLGSPNR